MKLNNIGYLLKEGFRSIFQHGFMSFAAICVTVACLIIVGSFSALAYNLDIMVQDLNKTSEIMVYIDSDLSDAEARSIGTKINLLDNVFDAKYVSREKRFRTSSATMTTTAPSAAFRRRICATATWSLWKTIPRWSRPLSS